jgi:hypothetical protein
VEHYSNRRKCSGDGWRDRRRFCFVWYGALRAMKMIIDPLLLFSFPRIDRLEEGSTQNPKILNSLVKVRPWIIEWPLSENEQSALHKSVFMSQLSLSIRLPFWDFQGSDYAASSLGRFLGPYRRGGVQIFFEHHTLQTPWVFSSTQIILSATARSQLRMQDTDTGSAYEKRLQSSKFDEVAQYRYLEQHSIIKEIYPL